MRQVSIGLRAAVPALADVGGVAVGAEWVNSSTAGNFKSKINPDGARTYYPLFRLVALDGDSVSNGPVLILSDEAVARRRNQSGRSFWRNFRFSRISRISEVRLVRAMPLPLLNP